MAYVDNFVVPVKRSDLEAYRSCAAEMARLWRNLGALSVVEAVGDGLTWGKTTSFPRAVLATDDEVVVMATIVWRDKAQKEAATAAAFADPAMLALMDRVPVDGARMIWGSFDVLVQEGHG
jgi:uncharacterized protein YbaA (DUF1428 family)